MSTQEECYIIYKTTNLVNGKIYVGQHHIKPETSATDNYLGSGKILKRSIKKYGKKNFIRETLEFCNLDNVDIRETFWILELNATDQKVGYNIICQGIKQTLRRRSKEENLKHSQRMKGQGNPMFGQNHSDETRAKMSQNHVDFTGSKNPNYNHGKYLYIFKNLDTNKIIKTKNLKDFCFNNNLNYNTLSWCFKVGQKIHKNFQLKRLIVHENYPKRF